MIGFLRVHTRKRIDYDKVFAPVARIEAIRLFLAYASFNDFVVYQMDVKSGFLYGKIEEEVYVCQPLGFEDPDFLYELYKVLKRSTKIRPLVSKRFSFDLVAYTDSDYAGASLDRKSTTGGCQFLGCRLISWPCKKQTMVANSTNRVKNPVFHSKTKHIEIRHHFIKVSNEKKLIQMIKIHTDKNVADLLTKAFDLQALVDRKKVIKTESIIRRDLHLEDAEGIDCLPNATIFKELTRMSAKTTAWNEFSSNMASAIICLATNKKFNFSKYIFESMVKNLDNAGKFLMYPRKDTSLFPTMMVQAQEEIGKGSANPTDPYHTPIITQPSTYQPQKKQSDKVADEAVNEEMDDNLERAATIATGLNAEPQETMRDTIAQTRSENVSKFSNDLLLTSVNTPRRGCIQQGRKIDDIDKDAEITLVDETHGLFNNEDIYLVNVYRDEDIFGVNDLEGDKVVVETDVAHKVVVETKVASKDVNLSVDEVTLAQALAALKSAKVQEKGDVIKEPSVPVSAASTKVSTVTLITTAATRPKAKGLVIHEEEQATTPTVSSQQPSQVNVQDKGKGKMIEEEPMKKLSKKDQERLDEELSFKLQAEEDEEERLAREKAQHIDEANIAWDDIQAKVVADYQLAQRLQAEEQEELSNAEKATLFVQLLEKRRKHFAEKRAEERRNRPPTKARQRSFMCTYLKNMEGWKPKDLKNKSFANIQELFNKAMKRVNTFVDIDIELVEESSKKAEVEIAQESSSKREHENLWNKKALKSKIWKKTKSLKSLTNVYKLFQMMEMM
ncbi:copia protein [Tanacetum coccineum]